jgi:cysteine desulfuration protein SufE
MSETLEDISEAFEFFDDWEDKYRFIIDLGKDLPGLPDEEKIDDNLIHGCQSQVWLSYQEQQDKLLLNMDSDAFIVRGLIAIVLAAYANKSRDEIAHFDMEALFEELDLLQHLSATRGNGLRAMIERIRQVAQSGATSELGTGRTGA